MKPSPAAIMCLAALLHGGGATAASCPKEPTDLPGRVAYGDLIFEYGILPEGALCGRLTLVGSEAWVALGAQPAGTHAMKGAHAVIAMPSANTVQQYVLNGFSPESIINSLHTVNQTLTETSIAQVGTPAATRAFFKLPLEVDGLGSLTSSNEYLLAHGTSNEFGYHGPNNKWIVSLDFERAQIASSNDGGDQDQNLRGQAIYSTLE